MTKTELLFTSSFGEETGVPLLIVHGLFGSGRNWRAIARFLAKTRWVVTVDLRNHGHSFWDAKNSYFDLADDLAAVIESVGGKADVMGHSMGGKASMVLALQNPDMVERLIIADIAPVGYAHSQSPNIEIMKSIPLDQFDRRSAVEAELKRLTGDAGLAAFFAQSLSFDGESPKWLLNLDALQDNMETIIGFPRIDSLFEKEVLFLRGSESDYVASSGQPEIDRLFPNAVIETIDGAGHWLHADKPREFMTILSSYISNT